MTKRYLVTPALPYVNGPAHLGHMVEHVQVNIFVRALRMAGKDVLYVCGADSHGTPIEINAAKAGMKPEEFAAMWQKSFDESFRKFDIEFDGGFGSTHTESNKRHAVAIFDRLKKAGHIAVRDVEQLFDPEANRFLPDRMVRGICPKCKAEDQYGDNCESCGTTYHPTDLIEPKSALTGAKPVLKTSKHYFFELHHYTDQLKGWTKKPGVIQKDVQNYLHRWFEEGLKDWDISRDGPYFGFQIPGEENKYFYVWLDAPIGYISLTEKAANEVGRSFEDYWKSDDAEIIHFIGKDIVYFHTLFWPAMLMGAKYNLPKTVHVHGMLTVDGEKMSKSRGTFILADTFAKYVDPEAFRYYLACKLSQRVEDIDLNFEDFTARVNSDLVNKVVNLVSRTVPLLHRYSDGNPGDMDPAAQAMLSDVRKLAANVKSRYEQIDTARATKEVVQIADLANRYLQDNAPWETAKTDKAKAQMQLTTALWVGKVCIGLLKPILPKVAAQTEQILNLDESITFENLLEPLEANKSLNKYTRLFERIDPKKTKQIIMASKVETEKSSQPENEKKEKAQTDAEHIQFDDFMKVELRAARVITAKPVEGADKLISVLLDVGPLGEKHVFAGLRPHVEPEDLVDRLVALVYNLKPRKMRFGVSEGMILACGDEVPVPVYLEGVKPGERIR